MGKLLPALMMFLLTAALVSADGFGYEYSSITGTGDDVFIFIEWTPTMIDPLCAPRPCCYNEVPADCCHYVIFYANASGVYYVGYTYDPVAFSHENGTYLLSGGSIYRAYRGCFQKLGDVSEKAKLAFPYIAAQFPGRLEVYHLNCTMDRIGSVKLSPECTFQLSSRNLIVGCPNGTEQFNLTPSGIFRVSSVDRWELMESRHPSMAEGKLENGTLLFSNGSRTYRIPSEKFLPYLYDERELKLLTGVFMEDYLLILPPVMGYAYCVDNGTFGSSLGFSSIISRSGFVIYDIKPEEFKPVYAFIYNGTLKPAPLFLPEGSYFRPLAENVTIREKCSCGADTETLSEEVNLTTASSEGKERGICGPGLLILMGLFALLIGKR